MQFSSVARGGHAPREDRQDVFVGRKSHSPRRHAPIETGSPTVSKEPSRAIDQVEVLDIVLEAIHYPEAVELCVDLLTQLKPLAKNAREGLEPSQVLTTLGPFVDAARVTADASGDAVSGPGARSDSLYQCLSRHHKSLFKRAPGPCLSLTMARGLEPEREWEPGVSYEENPRIRHNVASDLDHHLAQNGGGELETVTSHGAHHLDGKDSVDGQETPSDDAQGGSAERWPPLLPDVQGSPVRRLHVLFDDSSQSILGKVIVGFVTLTLVVSTVTFVMESMPEFRRRPDSCAELQAAGLELTVKDCEPRSLEVFYDIETLCIAVFTVDYIVRVATSHARPTEQPLSPGADNLVQRATRVLRYAAQPINVVDLLAILPYYAELASGDGLGSFQILRLARILRVFKMARHHPGMEMFGKVMYMSGQPFTILVFFNAIICLLFASLLFIVEGQQFSVAPEFTQDLWLAQANRTIPAEFPTGVFVRVPRYSLDAWEPTPFRSIPIAIWWVCVTLTTVGYGDMAPTTVEGKIIGVATFYVGILFLALPISILGSNFEVVYREYTEARRRRRRRHETSGPVCSRSLHKVELSWEEAPWFPRDAGLRKKVFLFFEQPSASKLGRVFSVLVIFTILAVTLTFVMESMPEFREVPPECDESRLTVQDCEPRPRAVLHTLEVIGICIFTFDYVCRVLTVHVASPEDCGLTAKGISDSACFKLRVTWCYCTQWLNMIDMLAILPFYAQIAIGGGGGGGMSVIRVLRLTRIFRVLRMRKLSLGVNMFNNVLRDSMPALSLLLFMTMMACVFFASCITYAEGSEYSVDSEWLQDYPLGVYVRPTVDGHDREVTPFSSILYAFWWFFVTATTVGYGDDFPTTTAGRLIGLAAMYCGIILLALPISVIGSSFGQHYWDWEKEINGAPSTGDRPTLGERYPAPQPNEVQTTSSSSCNTHPHVHVFGPDDYGPAAGGTEPAAAG